MFDRFVIVDWSAANGRKANQADCIWIASGGVDDASPDLVSPPSRTEAMSHITQQIDLAVDGNERLLIGFDFAFGYPAGFADLWLNDADRPAWIRAWEYLHQHVRDDLEGKPGRMPTNRSNRFDVGNSINAKISNDPDAGPFWCCEPNWRRRTSDIRMPSTQPTDPRLVPQLRQTDLRMKSSTPFCLFRTGSVGSQSLVGIPRVQQLRLDYPGSLAVWPMETGWLDTNSAGRFEASVIACEIYPSVRKPLKDTIKDRGQVRAIWRWARDMTRAEKLATRFAMPDDLSIDDFPKRGKPMQDKVLHEEGWILA